MKEKKQSHPYIASIASLTATINQLRSRFPAKIDAKTLKKYGLAPKNESFIIMTLRFLNLIDDTGQKIEKNSKAFSQSDDEKFQAEFSKVVKSSYSELFHLHADDAWNLDPQKLISFFRNHDGTSDLTGKRQSNTFIGLAEICGNRNRKRAATNRQGNKGNKTIHKVTKETIAKKEIHSISNDVALTVRIEINLPSGETKQTYDSIFRSIKENLLNG